MAEELTTPEASSEEAQPKCPVPRPVLGATRRATEQLSEGQATEGTTTESGESAGCTSAPKARKARAAKPAARPRPKPLRPEKHGLSPEGGRISSDESRETKRIRDAKRAWAKSRAPPPPDEGPRETQSYTYNASCPANSGLFAYASWIVREVLTIGERAKLHGRTFVYEECRRCPNIGRMVSAALSRAGAPDLTVEGLGAVEDEDSVLTPPPQSKSPSDIALLAVDCSPKGGAGAHLQDYLKRLDATPYEARPKVILVEFSSGVGASSTRRAVARGALTSMLERGYAGQSREANALSFCLPLRCPRTWCVLVKAVGFGPKSRQAAETGAETIAAVVERCQVPRPEHLTEVLARVQAEPVPEPIGGARAGWRQGRQRITKQAKYPGVDLTEAEPKQVKPNGKWPRTFTKYMAQHGLTEADLETDDGKKLREKLSPFLTPRELSKVLMLYADKKRQGHDLRQIAMVCDLSYACPLPVSASLSAFPEQLNGSKYAVLLKGEALLANCAHCLAVHGLQAVEASSFNLREMSPENLTVATCGGLVPNICLAFLTAALVTVD